MLGRESNWTAGHIPDQTGRTAVVTGANAGVGFHVTQELARRGATVVMACRDVVRAEAAAEAIRVEVPDARLEVRRLDLAELSSVAQFADEVTAAHERLDLLVNNAGLMSQERKLTPDGFELQFGVNYLGHYALTARLLPVIVRTPGSRVVMTSSLSYRFGRLDVDDLMFQRRPYTIWNAYFQSKLANVLFGVELNRRLTAAGAGTIALSAHPGIARTEIGPKAGLGDAKATEGMRARLIMQPAAIAALPTLRAGTAPAAVGGAFYGPRFVAFGHPVRTRLVRRAVDPQAAQLLWGASAELVGVEPKTE